MLEEASRMNTTSTNAGFSQVGDCDGNVEGAKLMVGLDEGDRVVGEVGERDGPCEEGARVEGTVGALERVGLLEGADDGSVVGENEGGVDTVVGCEEGLGVVGCKVVGVVGEAVGAVDGEADGTVDGDADGASEISKHRKPSSSRPPKVGNVVS
jgi:hypothetical protein